MLNPPSLSLSVEEQYQFIQPDTRALSAFLLSRRTEEGLYWREFRADSGLADRWQTTAPPVVTRVADLAEIVAQRRQTVIARAAQQGWRVAIAGTHPFASWSAVEPIFAERFHGVLGNVDSTTSRLLFFSLHVQVGVEDLNLAVDSMNVVRYLMPHFLAISASSPFWEGEDTGLRSYRAVLIDGLPRAGIPDQFSSWGSYRRLIDALLKTNSMAEDIDVWWDVRVHPRLPLLDCRVCDANPRLMDVLALAALFQAVVAWLWDLRRRNLTFRIYHGDLSKENRWRAARYGLDAALIDFGKQEALPARTLLRELFYLIMEYAEQLDSWRYLEPLFSVVETGNSAERQLRVYRETGSLTAVVDQLIAETAQGLG